MGEATKGLAPRAEAGPISWTNLTEAQRQVASRICRLLGAMADEPWTPPPALPPEGLAGLAPRIDARRGSRVVLIDGGRGSGKTSVLLTLLDGWKRLLAGQQIGVQNDGTQTSLPDAEQALSQAIVPIGLVDLEALPPNTNLLLQTVGQFQRVVDFLEMGPRAPRAGEGAEERPPWESPLGESPTKEAWRRFLTAATLGGADGMLGRRAVVDPEAFATEVAEAELHRMDIPACFGTLMDALAREIRARRSLPKDRHPLFVIAVDDADLSRALSEPLLRLIRELWHSRLVFLLTGDSKLLEFRLREEERKAFERLWRNPTGSSRNLSPEIDLHVQENDLVDQRLRKMIPPNHRPLVAPLRPDERLRLLESALEDIRAPGHPLQIANFAEYCKIVPQAQQVLPNNLRELQDLRQWLAEKHGTDGETAIEPEDIAWALTLHPKNYASRYSLLSESVSDALLGQVEKLGTDRKRWVSRDGMRDLLALDNHAGTVRLQSSGCLDIARSDDRNPPHPSSSDSWIVAIDVLFEDEPDQLEFVVPPLPAAVSTQRGAHGYEWPMPDWRSPIDYNALLWLLRRLLTPTLPAKALASSEGSSLERLSFDRILRSYLTAVLEYGELRASRNKHSQLRGLTVDLEEIAAKCVQLPTWESLAERASAHWDATDPNDPALRNWVRGEAGLVACPEIALEDIPANLWLAALKESFGEERWRGTNHELLRARESLRSNAEYRAQARRTDGNPSDSAEFESGFVHSPPMHATGSTYKWYELVSEDSEEDVSRTLQRFVERLEELPVRYVEAHPSSPRPTLRRYLVPELLSSLTRDGEAGPLEQWLEAVAGVGHGDRDSAIAVRELWETVTRAEAGMPPAPTELTTPRMMQIAEELGLQSTSWRFERSDAPSVLQPHVTAHRGMFRWGHSPELSPLARCAFQLAWDYTVDENDKKTRDGSTNRNLRWWSAAGCQEEGIFFPWPAVDWWAYLDHTLLAEAWDSRLQLIRGLSERLTARVQFGDDLAFWYVRMVDRIAEERIAPSREREFWQTSAGPGDWEAEIRRILDHSDKHSGSARWRCYQEWLRRAPLLAAPESGLSSDAAGWILDAFAPKDKTRLQRERTLRITEGAGQTRAGAAKMLLRLTRKYPDHPWTKVIGPGV